MEYWLKYKQMSGVSAWKVRKIGGELKSQQVLQFWQFCSADIKLKLRYC